MGLETLRDLKNFENDCVDLMVKYGLEKDKARKGLLESNMYVTLKQMIKGDSNHHYYLSMDSTQEEIIDAANRLIGMRK